MSTSDEYEDGFSARIRALIDEHGRQKICKDTGLSSAQLQRLRTGSDTTRKNLIEISKSVGANVLWLATGEGPKLLCEIQSPSAPYRADPNCGPVSSDYVQIPKLDIQAAAGTGSVVTTEEVTDMYSYKKEWLRRELGVPPTDLRIIRVDGESMAPTLRSGELIFVDMRKSNFTGDGVYIVRMGDAIMCKHVQRLPGHVLRVTSENTNYSSFDIKLDESSNDEVAIVGKVVYALSGRSI